MTDVGIAAAPAAATPEAANARPDAGARVFVGMSGGVDSSLAAALLLEAGYEVTGVYMRNWTRDLPGYKCPWAQDLADAERVAVQLGVELEVWDYEEQYRREVVDYLLDSYAHGRTPNPDVMCNERVKFGSFAREAFGRGADFIATGHYARTAGGRLYRAADEHKDQTYFLWRVPGAVLERTLFPIGGFASKAEVRAAAAERGIETADKPDSTGVCFIGPVSMRQFLLSQLGEKPGPVLDARTGERLGTHDGAFLFTLGQRKGLDLGGGPARWVVHVDVAENTVYTSDDRDDPLLSCDGLRLEDCRWVAGSAPDSGPCLVRTRHTRALAAARIEADAGEGDARTPGEGNDACRTGEDAGAPRPAEGFGMRDVAEGAGTRHARGRGGAHNAGEGKAARGADGGAGARIVFEHTEQAVACGQAVSIYRGDECLGGGFACAM